MKNILVIIVFLLIISFGFYYWEKAQTRYIPPLENFKTDSKIKNSMKIISSAFNNSENIPSKYTCNGSNINPPLSFSDIPTNTKSLVLIVDDPDAPMGTWIHWIVYNILPTTIGIEENSLPQNSLQGPTSFGKPGYGGPCPPSGIHHYHFKLYALNEVLTDRNLDKSSLEQKMQDHILAQAELIGLYSRQ